MFTQFIITALIVLTYNTSPKSDSVSNQDFAPFDYSENAVKITQEGEILKGKEKIDEYHKKVQFSPQSFESRKKLMANERRGLEYEIGEYSDKDKTKIKTLIIWKNSDSQKVIDFEVAVNSEDNDLDSSVLDCRREEWMKLCNDHKVEALVRNLYSSNTIYYNHKPVVIGHEDLIQEYGYMNNEKYSLTLSPIVIEPVSSDFIYEIGQCSGGYNGKYILIWRKEGDGQWRVFIDSNI